MEPAERYQSIEHCNRDGYDWYFIYHTSSCSNSNIEAAHSGEIHVNIITCKLTVLNLDELSNLRVSLQYTSTAHYLLFIELYEYIVAYMYRTAPMKANNYGNLTTFM